MSNLSLQPTETIYSVIQQYFAASRSDDKAREMAACFAEDCTCQDPVEAPALTSRDEVHQFFQSIVDLFASVELTEDFISINGQEAAVKWTGCGVGKNGCKVMFEGIDLFEVNSDGKIQSLRAYWNPSTMLTQLQSL